MNTTNRFARAVRIALVALSLLAWQLSVALADYDARRSEAMAELEKAQMSPEERASLKEVLGRYFEAREDCLEALVEIIKKQDKSEQKALFADRAASCASTASKTLSDGLRKLDDPSLDALGFVNLFAMHESSFFQGLTRLTVVDARDRIVVIAAQLAEKTGELREKWKTLVNQDETLDDRAKVISREIENDFKSVISDVAKANKGAAELLAEGVKQWAQAATAPNLKTGDADIDQLLSAIKYLLGPTIAVLQVTRGRWMSRADEYRKLFYSERRVLVMFEEVRGDVRKFLEENDFPNAQASYSAARASVDAFVSEGRTSGQRNDAAELRDDFMEALTDHLKRTAHDYDKFVVENREKFFGAIGPDVREEFLESDAWRKIADDVQGYGLDAKVREWQYFATNYFGVDLGTLSDDVRERLKRDLRYVIEDLVETHKGVEKGYRDVVDVVKNI